MAAINKTLKGERIGTLSQGQQWEQHSLISRCSLLHRHYCTWVTESQREAGIHVQRTGRKPKAFHGESALFATMIFKSERSGHGMWNSLELRPVLWGCVCVCVYSLFRVTPVGRQVICVECLVFPNTQFCICLETGIQFLILLFCVLCYIRFFAFVFSEHWHSTHLSNVNDAEVPPSPTAPSHQTCEHKTMISVCCIFMLIKTVWMLFVFCELSPCIQSLLRWFQALFFFLPLILQCGTCITTGILYLNECI